MSFPRAKIQRFNDVMNSVPSPTKYDPKIGDKVKGGCILKGEAKPATFSDTASAASSGKCQTPVFRTPQLPKKHNCLGTSEKGSHSAFKSITFRPDDHDFLNQDGDLEELRALRVECSNKTETINDMEKHIQDLKTQISNYEKSKVQLEACISELEIANSNLACIKSNNENYEQQINQFQVKIQEMDKKIEELSKSKEELIMKMEESEKKNNKLEESNLDYERKIISLEGTIEQLEMEHKNKEKILTELKHNEEVHKMNHQVSVECLKGKISTLENEIKEMDSNKSKNEATIFGLETQISNLNCKIEKLKGEKMEAEISSKELKSRLEEIENICKSHSDTITGLEMELENRVKEMQQLREKNSTLKTEAHNLQLKMEKEKASFEESLRELQQNHDREIVELKEKYEKQNNVLETEKDDLEAKRSALINSHAEEILQLQNDYESKLLAQMQENTDKINVLQCQLDEKDLVLKQSNVKYMRVIADWEKKLEDAENSFAIMVNKLESEHLGTLEEVKQSYSKRIRLIELNSAKTLDMKNKEIDILTEQYKEILGEVNNLLKDLENKDLEIKKMNGNNINLNSRLKLMLEEIKLLNKENETKSDSLKAMTSKFNEEFMKNEHLSCKMGELDGKIVQLKEDLNEKVEDWKKVSEELRKSKNLCNDVAKKKLVLETTVADLQEKVRKLMGQLDENRINHENEIKKVSEELQTVKTQCRKFEIVMGNTRKSLEALRERLLESENEVEKLNAEKTDLTNELKTVQKEKDELRNKFEDMVETKIDLETSLDEYLSINKELLQKNANLESLCDEFEAKMKELTAVNGDLEAEKVNNIQTMNDMVRKHELQLIETEKATLDQVEKVSQMLTEKLEFFMKFSTEKVQNLTTDIKTLKLEKERVNEALMSKTYDYDNLVTDNEILKTTVEITVKESEELKNNCKKHLAELEKLENLLSELKLAKEKAEEMLITKTKECANLVEERDDLRKMINEKVAELDKVRDLKNDMETEVNNLRCRLEEQNLEMENKDRKVKDLELKVPKLETKLEEKDTEIASCMKEILNLNSEKEDLLFNMKVTEAKMSANEKLTEELRQEKLKIESQVLALKEENERLGEGVEKSLEEIEERKNYYKANCRKLDAMCAELTEENKSLKNDFNEIHGILQEKDKKLEELVKRCSDLESLIGPFREQLEQYENERMLIENDREQLRKQHLEQAAKLGHQNHKQKIKHVVKLKNTLLESRKENEKLILEITNLKKKVQKLQEELGQHPKRLFIGGKRPSSTPFKGKENSTLLSPTAGTITPMNIKQEPMSPGSPLRNRNQ